jgi:hypothetical protein
MIARQLGGRVHEHPALAAFYGLDSRERDTPRAYRLYEEASLITSASADDPPGCPVEAPSVPRSGAFAPREDRRPSLAAFDLASFRGNAGAEDVAESLVFQH